MARPIPPRLEQFKHIAADTVRFGDTDRIGHVNNAVFATYFETGRITLLHDPVIGIIPPGCTLVLARITIDFLAELQWGGMIKVATAVMELGTSSVSFIQALYKDGTCPARAESVVVLIDTATRRPRPWPEDARSKLEVLRLAADGHR